VLLVPVQHLVVIHLVDVVSAENQSQLGRFGFDALEILENRVAVPGTVSDTRFMGAALRCTRQFRDRMFQPSRMWRSGPAICTVLGLEFDGHWN